MGSKRTNDKIVKPERAKILEISVQKCKTLKNIFASKINFAESLFCKSVQG